MKSLRQIDDQISLALAWEANGGTAFPGMTYEQGVYAALTWATDQAKTPPIETDPNPNEPEDYSKSE